MGFRLCYEGGIPLYVGLVGSDVFGGGVDLFLLQGDGVVAATPVFLGDSAVLGGFSEGDLGGVGAIIFRGYFKDNIVTIMLRN